MCLNKFLALFIDRQEVLLQEVESDDKQVFDVERPVLHFLREKLADLVQVQNARGLCRLLARGLAAGKELVLVRRDRRVDNQMVI